MAHTKGPWFVGLKVEEYVFIKSPDRFSICIMTQNNHFDPYFDAYLIAAAPEMYDCLVLIKDHFVKTGIKDISLLRAINETLAKAVPPPKK